MTFCATAVSCSGRPLHRQHSGYLSGFGLLEASSYPETTSRSAWPPNLPSHRLITSWQPTAINMLVYATTEALVVLMYLIFAEKETLMQTTPADSLELFPQCGPMNHSKRQWTYCAKPRLIQQRLCLRC